MCNNAGRGILKYKVNLPCNEMNLEAELKNGILILSSDIPKQKKEKSYINIEIK